MVSWCLLGLCRSLWRERTWEEHITLFGSFSSLFFVKQSLNFLYLFSFCQFKFLGVYFTGFLHKGWLSKRSVNSFPLPKATIDEGMDFHADLQWDSWDCPDLCTMQCLHGVLSFFSISSWLLLYWILITSFLVRVSFPSYSMVNDQF